VTSGPDPNGEPRTEPLHIAPPSAQPEAGGVAPDHSVPPTAIGHTANDACPTCSARMAPDQRYCLNCGHRRGDPRLPFMDAVVFMDSVKQSGQAETAAAAPPPPPSQNKSGFSPQTTLIAGVATLILAVGVGVLIGRGSGNDSAPVANSQPQIIKVGGSEEGGGGEETEAATGGNEAKGAKEGKKNAKGKGDKKSAAKEKAPEPEEGSNGGSKASEEVLHTSENAKPQAKATVQKGETCEKGSAGCSESGEFDGSFFE
jgi:hypothetical protein